MRKQNDSDSEDEISGQARQNRKKVIKEKELQEREEKLKEREEKAKLLEEKAKELELKAIDWMIKANERE